MSYEGMPPYANGHNDGLSGKMEQMGIDQSRVSRKKKTRHVLDASVNETDNKGFAQSQFMSQGRIVPQAQATDQYQVGVEQPQHGGGSSQSAYTAENVSISRMSGGQFPDVAEDAVDEEDYYRHNLFYTGQRAARNPSAGIDFSAIDHGASNPKYARLSMASVPTTEELLTTSQLPLSLMLQPFADLNADEGTVPIVDCRQTAVPRCHRCRTYMNPSMLFHPGGNKYTCNICGFANETLPEYYSPADANGQRQDWAQRPELQYGTCDFLVGKDYWAKGIAPKPVSILFAIDVSEQALARGVSQTAVAAIKEALYESESSRLPQGAQIAIMTFDRSCHFYNLQASLGANTQMLEVADVEDMFVPIMDGLFVDPIESRATIEATLESIGYIFGEDKSGVPEPALGAVTRAAYLALGAVGGGKLSLFMGALPTWGSGKLRMRDNSAMYGTPEERTLYDAANVHWKNIADEFAGIGVGVDCFFFPNSYIDLATIGLLSQTTGGDIFYYPNFFKDRDGDKFAKELQRSLLRTQAYAVQMKLRCSNGLKVDSIIGHLLQKGNSDLEMGSTDADKAITFILKHEGKLSPQAEVYFQSAILFTDAAGQRVLRTHNVKCVASSVISEVMRSADLGATVATLAKLASLQTLKIELKAVKQMMTERLIRVLTAYRRECVKNATKDELILPDALRTFPLLVLAVQKQFSFRTDPINSDVRVNNQRLLKRSSVRDILSLIHPRIIPLHRLAPEDGFPDETGRLKLPAVIKNTFKEIEDGGVYLCDNGQQLLLWLHRDVNPAFLQDLFGPECTTLESVKPRTTRIPVLDSFLNVQVRNIIHYLNTFSTSRHLVPQIVRQTLDSEATFGSALVDDRNGDNMSYPDFVTHVHRRVQFMYAEGQQTKTLGGWLSGNEQAY